MSSSTTSSPAIPPSLPPSPNKKTTIQKFKEFISSSGDDRVIEDILSDLKIMDRKAILTADESIGLEHMHLTLHKLTAKNSQLKKKVEIVCEISEALFWEMEQSSGTEEKGSEHFRQLATTYATQIKLPNDIVKSLSGVDKVRAHSILRSYLKDAPERESQKPVINFCARFLTPNNPHRQMLLLLTNDDNLPLSDVAQTFMKTFA